MSNACTAYSKLMLCLVAENLRGGRYYIGAVKTAERMVVIAVNAEVHSVIFSNMHTS